MDKTCLEIRDLIALGPDTAPNERIAIESHVAICAECARELAEMRTHLGNLGLLREGEMPAGTAERTWRGVQSAVPGRRPAFLAWSIRVAAILVIGLSVGYTSMSVAGRTGAAAGADEEMTLDETRPSFVPRMLTTRSHHDSLNDPPAPVAPGGLQFQLLPRASTWHYLPHVDEILEPETVRF